MSAVERHDVLGTHTTTIIKAVIFVEVDITIVGWPASSEFAARLNISSIEVIGVKFGIYNRL